MKIRTPFKKNALEWGDDITILERIIWTFLIVCLPVGLLFFLQNKKPQSTSNQG